MVTNPDLKLYYYLLLVTSAVNGIIPVTYPEQVSSQCGQSNPLQDKRPSARFNNSLVGTVLKVDPVKRFFSGFHQPPQVSTRYRLAIAQLYRSSVTWKGPNVKEREAGQEWPTLT